MVPYANAIRKKRICTVLTMLLALLLYVESEKNRESYFLKLTLAILSIVDYPLFFRTIFSMASFI